MQKSGILNRIHILNLVFTLAVFAGGHFYMSEGGTLLKGIASSIFVLMGAVNLWLVYRKGAANLRFSALMVAGLFFCMVGDVALNIHFIAGALVFALGHVFYFLAYSALIRFRLTDLIPTAVIFAAAVLYILIAPYFDFGSPVMLIVVLFYALIIASMCGKAISNAKREPSLANLLIALGSCLFFFSDFMLVHRMFAGADYLFSVLCMCTYYPAQCLLAYAVFRPHTL